MVASIYPGGCNTASNDCYSDARLLRCIWWLIGCCIAIAIVIQIFARESLGSCEEVAKNARWLVSML